MGIPAYRYSDSEDQYTTMQFFPLIKLIRFQNLKKDVMTYIEQKVDVAELPSPYILMDHLDKDSFWFKKLFHLKPWTRNYDKLCCEIDWEG